MKHLNLVSIKLAAAHFNAALLMLAQQHGLYRPHPLTVALKTLYAIDCINSSRSSHECFERAQAPSDTPERSTGGGNMSSEHKLNSEDYLRMYRQMVRIRVFEDNANQLYLSAKMPGLTHMYSGEEAVAVGICEALEVSDKITSTHRGHGHCVAKGAEFKEMFCELLGKAGGYCRGKGGSMHIADQAHGNLGANAIVGGSAGIATGAALSAKRLGTKDVTVCFFGDGALGQGLLYEVMNMAALWKLPVIYACENNLYGEYTKVEEMAAGALTARAAAFGIETHVVDGQDVLAVNQLTRELVARARRGEGPFFMQINTYRYHGHHVGDINREYYRSKAEETFWKTERDPITNFGNWLMAEKIATEDELKAVDKSVRAEAEAAVEYALAAPYPDAAEVRMHVYAENAA
jgi:TPP-dependent pyruvate/acetoin dehydrogenase alpha subunit